MSAPPRRLSHELPLGLGRLLRHAEGHLLRGLVRLVLRGGGRAGQRGGSPALARGRRLRLLPARHDRDSCAARPGTAPAFRRAMPSAGTPAQPRPAGRAHRQYSTPEVAPPPRLYCRADESRRRLRPARPALGPAGPGRSWHSGGDPRAQEMISVSCRASAGGSVVPQGPGKWNLEGSGRFRARAGTGASRCFTWRVWRGHGRDGGRKEEEEEERGV